MNAKKIALVSLIFFLSFFSIFAFGVRDENEGERMEQKSLINDRLTEFEYSVIEQKATERPFTGEYTNSTDEGIYVCKRCGQPLYNSEDKFDSKCGWPSFDDEIEGAITRVVDQDGIRTEIVCSTCSAHLGHIFIGEGYTDKNTRHCVNSVSMHFIPGTGETGRAVFAGGCFWGVEFYFNKTDGVISTTVGYSGGTLSWPSYREVCTGETGHLEVIEVIYDSSTVTYDKLVKLFFEIHDPTQENGQGPDIGGQYLSAIFYENQSQLETAEGLIDTLKGNGYSIVTQLRPAVAFWPAENYHQDYYSGNGKMPYCHVYTKRY